MYQSPFLNKAMTFILIAFVVIPTSFSVKAHLPSYEGERVRNSNHFTRQGFAWPVRGACDANASGPTDPNAGSANIFLGKNATPPNFFCNFVTQDDWSFEYPLDIIEASRTPAPDPSSLGLPLEEGYIPCSPSNSDPFQCPRAIKNPITGQEIQLPGQCVDLGQPNDPAGSSDPDGDYHCALLPGSPRPRTSSVLFSTLTGPRDVDWALYHYDPVYAEVPIVGASQVPACRESIAKFPTFAYAGPRHLRDARTGELLFVPVEEAGPLPAEILAKLPAGYGIRVKRPSPNYRPGSTEPRPGYASGYGQNAWLLAQDSVIECIDSFEKCLVDDTGTLKKHYNYNDIFFLKEDESVELYLMWWLDKEHKGYGRYRWPRLLNDVSITTGVIDQFLVGDFQNTAVTGSFSGNGRYIHGRCRDPRPSGRVDIVIESN